MQTKNSITKTFLINMVVISIFTIGLVGYFWISSEYTRFNKESKVITNDFFQSHKSKLKNQVNTIVEYIHFMDKQTEQRLKESIKEKVLHTHNIAMNIYRKHVGVKSPDEIKQLIKKTLEHHRMDNQKGVFIIRDSDFSAQLFRDKIKLKEKNSIKIEYISGKNTVSDSFENLKKCGEGFADYFWEKPGVNRKTIFKTAYIKLFEPFEWYFGSEEFFEKFSKQIKKEVINRIESLTLEKHIDIAAGQWDGLILSGPDKGKIFFDIYSDNIIAINEELINFSQKDGGFIIYLHPEIKEKVTTLCYAGGIKNWNWYISARVNMDKVENIIAPKHLELKNRVKNHIFKIIFILITLGLVIYVITSYISYRTKNNFNMFLSFFKKAVNESTTINSDKLHFSEFKLMAESANIMIKERNDAENALRESEELFRKVFETSPDGLIIYREHDGLVNNVNQGLCELTGWSKEEAIDKYVHEMKLLSKQDRKQWVINLKNFRSVKNQEFSFYCKNNNSFQGLLSGNIITLNETPYVLSIIRDVNELKKTKDSLLNLNESLEQQVIERTKEIVKTNKELNQEISEHKRTENALEKAKIAADAANIAKGNFLANMSHEIRTPMNGILGMTSLLLETSLNKEQQDFGEVIQSSTNALLAIINDILDFSKIESGKMTLHFHEFDLLSTIENIIELLSVRASEKNLTISFQIEDDVPLKLQGDQGRVRQILINLTDNAIKFTHKGHIDINVSVENDTQKNNTLKFTITDTGIGIPQARLNQLFNSFTQVDTSISRIYGGTGLGLAISKQLSEMMGGKVGLESEEGKGSVFWFTAELEKFPAIQDKTYQKISSTLENEIPMIKNKTLPYYTNDSKEFKKKYNPFQKHCHNNKHILLAEDNAVNQKLAILLLKKMGFRVHAVSNGKKAVESLEKIPFDLVLMDIQMPLMDGLEATRIIRDPNSNALNHNVPIVAMTAHVLEIDRKNCFLAGMNDFIPKPVKRKILSEVLEKQLFKADFETLKN